jgi:hypothetical protein
MQGKKDIDLFVSGRKTTCSQQRREILRTKRWKCTLNFGDFTRGMRETFFFTNTPQSRGTWVFVQKPFLRKAFNNQNIQVIFAGFGALQGDNPLGKPDMIAVASNNYFGA